MTTTPTKIKELEDKLQKLEHERNEISEERYELDTDTNGLWDVKWKLEKRKCRVDSITKDLSSFQDKLENLIGEYVSIEDDLADQEWERIDEIEKIEKEIQQLKGEEK